MTDESEATERTDEERRLSRRRLLFGGGAALTIGGGKALHNVALGYGQLGRGTNLREQPLSPLVTERLSLDFEESIAGTKVRLDGSTIAVGSDGDRLSLAEDDRSDAAALDRAVGLNGRLEGLFVDISTFRADQYTFEFHQPEAFFERVGDAQFRPGLATAIRSNRDRTTDPAVIERFADADPSDTAALVEGLVEGFREHTSYDVPRYLAGSIEDNVIFGTHDVRQYFEEDVDFESLLEADGTGIFCWELVFRSMEALHAVPASDQTVPVAACYVSDSRHKHAFTGVLSVIRVDGELRLPMTFLDYTHTTLYDDLHATAVLGEGLAAYNTGHRATDIYW